jgi:type II secretory pathway pseudopilin PulG
VPAPARPRRSTSGLTLVEITLIISLISILLAAALPAFVRALRTSKIGEASRELARMQAQVIAYYAATHETSAGPQRNCLPDAAGPAPATPSPQPVAITLADPATPGHATWRALGLEPESAIRYRYSFVPDASGCELARRSPPPTVRLRAEGDLDSDGTLSLFERTLRITDGELAPDPLLFAQDRTE